MTYTQKEFEEALSKFAKGKITAKQFAEILGLEVNNPENQFDEEGWAVNP